QGLAKFFYEFSGKGLNFSYEYYVSPVEDPPLKLPRLGKNEKKFWELIIDAPATPLSHFRNFFNDALQIARSLVKKQLIVMEKHEVSRDDPNRAINLTHGAVNELTQEQQEALKAITLAQEEGRGQNFLLFGVTGSGKTEVYLRAAQKALSMGKGVLWLAPEIALTMGLETRVRSLEGAEVAVLHSKLSPGERHDHWLNLTRGRARVALGARSAVFAPLHNLGLIVVDEEHDWAYKQEDGLRYNGRDLALWRAKENNAVLILGSATPSLESFYGTQTGRLTLLEMKSRPQGAVLPEVTICDRRGAPRGAKVISRILRESMLTAFAKKEQALLFINRKGYSSLPICLSCGAPLKCPHCSLTLTLHGPLGEKNFPADGEAVPVTPESVLVCHGCGFRAKPRHSCPECGQGIVRYLGVGTEKLQELVETDLRAKGLRMDALSTRKKGGIKSILESFGRGEVDFLVGTQMAAKGHDFSNLTVVGVVDADIGLNMPDFRASERTYQLLSQVSGRAGRAEKRGKVIIQTLNPEHYSLVAAKNHDYFDFFENEIKIREELGLPPFGRLALIRFSGENEEEVIFSCEKAGEMLRSLCEGYPEGALEVLGPAPSPISRLKERFRYQIMFRSQTVQDRHRVLRAFLPDFRKSLKKTVIFTVDIDPYHLI
ncbi:MAG: primosomal protein N', partial [Deltaproteobacteria bacterium]|nr:primosomal protein N' [Deltaproteobacteria bacterium]